jgi:hypothetical protein
LQYLFDSQGRHIANFVNGQLHALTGQNIGHFLEGQSIFIDMHGRYLGEIVAKNRLLYRPNSPHRSITTVTMGTTVTSATMEIRATMARLERLRDLKTYLKSYYFDGAFHSSLMFPAMISSIR